MADIFTDHDATIYVSPEASAATSGGEGLVNLEELNRLAVRPIEKGKGDRQGAQFDGLWFDGDFVARLTTCSVAALVSVVASAKWMIGSLSAAAPSAGVSAFG